jgi:hypothetical protein
MKLKLDMDNPADREKLRRAVSILSPGKNAEAKRGSLKSFVLFLASIL